MTLVLTTKPNPSTSQFVCLLFTPLHDFAIISPVLLLKISCPSSSSATISNYNFTPHPFITGARSPLIEGCLMIYGPCASPAFLAVAHCHHHTHAFRPTISFAFNYFFSLATLPLHTPCFARASTDQTTSSLHFTLLSIVIQ
jgi:hypothetical protein